MHHHGSRPRLVALAVLASLAACTASSGAPATPPPPPDPVPPAAGPDPDRPVFVSERGGVTSQPWGIAGGYWPEQLFWEDVQFVNDHWNDMVLAADGIEGGGLAPSLGVVGWGIDLTLANGGDASQGLADFSHRDGFEQYAAWMNPRRDDYFARNEQGEIAYPGQGYVFFGMPMLPADRTDADVPETFGEWAGERAGRLALDVHCRGVQAADFFIGLSYFTDWHPRLTAAFGDSIGATIPGASVPEQRAWVRTHALPEWLDFMARGQASFYVRFGETVLAGGARPLMGGQIANDPAIARWFGNDPRLWERLLPGPYWNFHVETQSAGDRDTPPFWTSLAAIGATAARSSQVAIGAMLDADLPDYWNATERAGWSRTWGRRYLEHTWLAAGWAHVAGADGRVRRAAQYFVRSFWDAGGVDPYQWSALLNHVPKHPFGPAFYYPVSVERSYEAPPPAGSSDPANYYWALVYLRDGLSNGGDAAHPQTGALQGLNVGYWVSDEVDPASLAAADRPAAWLVFSLERLPAAERARLAAVAPVIDPRADPAAALAAGPLRTRGAGLTPLAFVDQRGDVVVMVTNSGDAAVRGALEVQDVEDGAFAAQGILGTPSGSLLVSGHQGTMAVDVAARDTAVWVISGLHWIGH
jgi:hypothetical protein